MDLRRDWPTIFPRGNRNAGGAQWFAHTLRRAADPRELDAMNRLWCGISGSTVRSGSAPDWVRVPGDRGDVCGNLYRCCWPCSCDAQRFTRAEEMTLTVGGEDITRTVLTIPDPCAAGLPRGIDAHACEAGRTTNGVHAPSGRLVTGILHDVAPCMEQRNERLDRQCAARDATAVCDLRGGMGDLFAQLATGERC